MILNPQFGITKSRSYIMTKDEVGKRWTDIFQAYKQAKWLLFIVKTGMLYMILKAILYYRINSYHDQILYTVTNQKLIPKKINFINNWVLKI